MLFALLLVLIISTSSLVYAQNSAENLNWFQKLINIITSLFKPATTETSTIATQTENATYRNLTPVTPANEPLAKPVEKIDDSGRHLTYINASEFYKDRVCAYSACYGTLDYCFKPEQRKGENSTNYFKSLNLTDDYIYAMMQFETLDCDPTNDQMNLLAADNITLFEYHGEHTYYAKIPKFVLETKYYDFVRWTGVAENASWKVERNLRNKTFGKNCTGDIQLDINFYQNIQDIPSYNNKKDLIMNLSLNLIGEYRESISVNASVTNIYKIASFNFINRIWGGGTPISVVLGGPDSFRTLPDPLESIRCYD